MYWNKISGIIMLAILVAIIICCVYNVCYMIEDNILEVQTNSNKIYIAD